MNKVQQVRTPSHSIPHSSIRIFAQRREMSSRHLRRVKEQLQQDPSTGGNVEEEEEEEDGEEEASISAKPFNPFDLLSDDDEVQS